MWAMIAELELAGLDFDPSVLEAYVGACVAIAGLIFLINKLLDSPVGTTGPGDKMAVERTPPAGATAPVAAEAAAAEPAPEKPADPKLPPRERRSSARRGGKAVKVLLSDPDGIEPPLVCWVIDRSRGGLGLVTPRLVPIGTVLDLRAAHAGEDVPPVRVEVRSCRRRGYRWKLGCQFTAEVPWNTLLLFG
jgi:hypothetical protein